MLRFSGSSQNPCNWGYGHFEIRLGKSGYCQHSCNMTFGCFSLFDIVGAY